MTLATKRKLAPWIAAGFCAFLSLITVTANIVLSFVNGTSTSDFTFGFLCFLPMCFVFAGFAMQQMQREIRDLKQQVADLRGTHDNAQPG